MSVTIVTDLAEQVGKVWSPILKDEVIETSYLPALVNKEFEGQIMRGNDTVYVSMINRPVAERKQVGAGSDSFSSQKMTTTRVGIVADQRITASFELEDLVDLQTQMGSADGQSKIRQVLAQSLQIALNDYCYSLVAPSATPDHTLTSVTDMNASQLNTVRKLASQAKWMREMGWYGLLDPSYYSDLLNAQTLVSVDNVNDKPIVGGQIATTRFGFNLFEDNSDALLGLHGGTEDAALFFHPDFLYLVMGEPQFKLSSLHSNKQHGYLLSVDMWCGAKLGLEGDIKHITVVGS